MVVLRNTVANTLGLLTGPVLSLVLVPFYIHYLGLESYGLVGFFTALQLVLAVFSQGISIALQRETAQRLADPVAASSTQALLRSFEALYGAIGVLCALALLVASGFIASSWLRLDEIDVFTARLALMFLSVRIGASFLYGLYQSIFIGSQRQVLGNAISVSGAVLSATSAVSAVLAFRSIAALCAAEALAALAVVVVQRVAAYRVLPPSPHPLSIDWREVGRLGKLSAGLIWTSGAGVLITQFDRLLLAGWLPASALAVYNAGVAGGRIAGMIYGPFLTAVYPETCRLAATGSSEELTKHVWKNAAIVAALCVSFGLYLCYFSRDILWVWTRNLDIARDGPPVMAIYVIGNMLQAYATVFYLLQTAKGTVRYPAIFNAISLLWYPIALKVLFSFGGLAGAASTWLIYCLATLIILAVTSYRRFLIPSAWKEYACMIFASALIGAGTLTLIRFLMDVAGVENATTRLFAALLAPIFILIGVLGIIVGRDEIISLAKNYLNKQSI